MKDTELHNLFKVAESREIKPEKIAEFLISNGCQIYVHFIKQISGVMVFEGFKKVYLFSKSRNLFISWQCTRKYCLWLN